MVTCIEVPGLEGISTEDFIEFKRYMEIFKEQIKDESRHQLEDFLPTSSKASIHDDDFQIFVLAGWLEASSIVALTERQVQAWVEERCKHKTDAEHLYLVGEAV